MTIAAYWTRFGAICLLVTGFHFSAIGAKAETAAEFFAKDKGLWHSAAGNYRAASRDVNPARGRRAASSRTAGGRGVAPRGSRGVIAAMARRQGVPVRLALAVVAVESRGNCRAVGRAGELGPLQIKLRTARGLGYRGSAAGLRNCGVGLYWGMRHLALSYRKCRSAVLHQKGLAGSCRRTSYSAKVQRMASRI